MRYLGMDLSRKTSTFYVSDARGKKIASGTIENLVSAFESLVHKHKDGDGLKVAIETGNGVFKYARAMRKAGAEVFVVDTYQNALIRESSKKTDKLDAKQLCEQLRKEQLPPKPVYIPTEEEEELRFLVKNRATLVKERTMLSNQTVRIGDRHAYHMKKSALSSTPAWHLLMDKASGWHRDERLSIQHAYERFLLLQKQIHELDNEIATRRKTTFAKQENLLETIPGLGPVTKAAIIARFGNIDRFTNSRELCRYTGLAPSIRQSGNFGGRGGISKQGNALLRSYLTQAALAIILRKNEDDPLYRWYLRVQRRRGWKKARIALARKLTAIIFGVLKHERPYSPEMLYAPRIEIPTKSVA